MTYQFKILTVTHRQTNLKNISRYILSGLDKPELMKALHDLKSTFQLQEIFYLATCNRVLFCIHTAQKFDEKFKSDFLRAINPTLTDQEIVIPATYEGDAAITHLLQVASSIDSMVVGEREILRQLRDAYDECHQADLCGEHLKLWMQTTVSAAKDVFTRTKIGEKPVSIVALAGESLLAAKLPKQARILLIGAGQTNTLVAKFLLKHQYRNVTVFNRTLQKAETIAATLGGNALHLDNLQTYKAGFDCLIVCTGVPHAIIDTELYQQLLGTDTDKKIVVDLAIPYNVAEEIPKQFETKYIEIEGLRELAQQNLSFRTNEIEQANLLLDEHIAQFKKLHVQKQLAKAMKHLPEQIKAVKANAIENVFRKRVENLDAEAQQLIIDMMEYMEKQCIGLPMKAARESILA